MLVLKFGGSSVANPDMLRRVTSILSRISDGNSPCFVVVSAFQGITDNLISSAKRSESGDLSYKKEIDKIFTRSNEIIHSLLSGKYLEDSKVYLEDLSSELKHLLHGVYLLREASDKTIDLILSFGERICAYVLDQFLQNSGINSQFIDARKYIKTDNNYGSANVDYNATYQNISTQFSNYKGIAVVTGFIASEIQTGSTTTLGRGGSDFTAALFANALDAEELQIWTDVSGVMSADPRKVHNAYTILELSYLEALELSHFGAKVLYAPTIHPVRAKAIPTRIKNTYYPEHPGSLIHKNAKANKHVIAGVTGIEGISIVTVEGTGLQGVTGTALRLFASLASYNINVIMVTQASSEHSISLAVSDKDAKRSKSLIEKEFKREIQNKQVDPIKLIDGLSLIAIVGENMKNKPGVAGKLFNTLGKNGINIEAIAQGSSELNISFAISSKDHIKALNTIHDSFFLSGSKTVHLFMIGAGLVGKKLLEIITNTKENILRENRLDIQVHALSNSSKMLLSKEALETSNILEDLQCGDATDIDTFLEFMYSCNFSNSIFVDNTASSYVPTRYIDILQHSIAISTPNKNALSSDKAFYEELKQAAFSNNTSINFETNVGAGLPVISTLHNLVKSGDRVIRIEAVLSGSLSFIFNNYTSSISFTGLVKKAKDQGFTEPDPREDLSGNDAKRKLLIMGRESGFNLEMKDINFINWISEETMGALSVDDFYTHLQNEEDVINRLVKSAEEKFQKLRLIGVVDKLGGTLELKAVSNDSPFYTLSGSDNMIAYYTERYSDTPLIIRGPGAGAEVTAAGVLAEIINIAT